MTAEAGPFRMILTLGLAGLLSGATVVGAYEITRPAIEANQAAALEHALYQVLPGATSKRAWVWDGQRLVPWEGQGIPSDEQAVYAGYDEAGERVGFAIPAEGPGFQDTIGLIYGVDVEAREVLGMRVLQSLETPGLGDAIVKDQGFLADFEGLAIEPAIEAVKGGAGEPHQIDAISGATISSKAVVDILNEANATWLERLPPDEGGAS